MNARLRPFDRQEIEDTIENFLIEHLIGEVTGGGTLQEKSGEVANCDIVMDINRDMMDNFMSFIKKIPIPKGSYLYIGNDNKIEIGEMEELALYLNGTELPVSVYESCDINFLIDELKNLLDGVCKIYSYWIGESETALYFYGTDFDEMKNRITSLLESYPLCEKCRVIQLC